VNNAPDTIVEVVDHTADRPAFSDRGDQPVHETSFDDQNHPAKPPRKPRKRKTTGSKKSADSMTDEELLREAGIEPIFSTSEAAEFFDRSNQWLYWGLREGVFLDEDGTAITPDRVGESDHGRRRFTVSILRDIMKSSYRRGNLSDEQLAVVMRRIKLAEERIEWREREGWHYTHLGRNRHRWVKPDLTVWNSKVGEWNLAPGVKLRNHAD
jgi:hypothetical protein